MTNIIAINEEPDGTLVVEYEWVVSRFLLDDGRTVDIKHIMDGSWLRDALLKHTKAKQLAGSVQLPAENADEAAPAPQPRKKVPAKRRPRNAPPAEGAA